MRKRDLTHVREVLHEIACAMTEDRGEDCEEGEEDAGPGGQVGEENMVDMNPSLGSKHQVQQKQQHHHAKHKGRLERQDVGPPVDEAAGDNLQVTKHGGDADQEQEDEEEASPEPASADSSQGCLYKSDSS